MYSKMSGQMFAGEESLSLREKRFEEKEIINKRITYLPIKVEDVIIKDIFGVSYGKT